MYLALAHSGSIATARVASERAPDGFFMARHAADRLLHPRASPGAIDIPRGYRCVKNASSLVNS